MPPSLKNVSIKLEDDGIAMINYNRPKNANSLGNGTLEDLLKAFTWALDNHEVKVIVHSGEGRFFCAGMDLVDVPKEGPVLPDAGVEILG